VRARAAARLATVLAVGLAVTGLLSLVHEPRAGAVVEGPVPGYTGGFGEPTCTTCHFDSPAEPAEGGLTLEGVPDAFEPGARYEVTIALRDPGLERGGYQLAVRWAEGPSEGRQAGRLAATDGRSEVVLYHKDGKEGEAPVLYARQTREGARPEAPGSARWTLLWTAPERPEGAVVFHAAGNAANYDDSELGDVVHTRDVRSRPAARDRP
jgi:hypothetical protein